MIPPVLLLVWFSFRSSQATCSHSCGHGVCVGTSCVCDNKWAGPACDQGKDGKDENESEEGDEQD